MYPLELKQWQEQAHEFTPFHRIYAYYRAETHWIYFKTPYWGDFVSCVSHIGQWDGKLWGVSWGVLPQVLSSIRRKNLLQCRRATVVFHELGTSVMLGGTAVFASSNRERTRFHSYPSLAARLLFGFDRLLIIEEPFTSAVLYNSITCQSVGSLMEVEINEFEEPFFQKISLAGDHIDARSLGLLGDVLVGMFELKNVTIHSHRNDLNFVPSTSDVVDQDASKLIRQKRPVWRIL